MNSSDNEYEEEEELVVVHLAGVIDPEYIRKCDPNNCRVLGIDSEHPVLQIDKMCFQGTYEDSVGTNIIFEERAAGVVDGKLQTEIKYSCHTTKELDMIRVFFNKKENLESKTIETGEALPESTLSTDSIAEPPDTSVESDVQQGAGGEQGTCIS